MILMTMKKPDRDNVVYYDTEKGQFYIIKWEDGGNSDTPKRYYIQDGIKSKFKKRS